MNKELSNNELQWKELYTADFSFQEPFKLMVENEFLYASEIKRIVPKRRMVVMGRWKNQEVVAKLFLDPMHAKRHYNKELAGIKALQHNKIPSPTLLWQGRSQDKRFYILIFTRILKATSLLELWQADIDKQHLNIILRGVMIELATQHVLGVMQKDLHLGNFLISRSKIYTLDGGQITATNFLLPKNQSIQQIALFFAQLGADATELYEPLFKHYATARGWLLKSQDFQDLLAAINQINAARWKHFNKKIFRDCTHFQRINRWGKSGAVNRKFLSPELELFFLDPDAVFRQQNVHVLKAGRSSTVIKVMLGKKIMVVKRYNLKNPLHFLRRLFRKTRAYHGWRLAHKFILFNIATPTPIAYLENKWFGLHGKSYFVSEYIDGEPAATYLSAQKNERSELVMALTRLLKNVFRIHVSHGDLKLTNILIAKNSRPMIIDFDGSHEHISSASLKHAWRKDIKRFLENFHAHPQLLQSFKSELAQVE